MSFLLLTARLAPPVDHSRRLRQTLQLPRLAATAGAILFLQRYTHLLDLLRDIPHQDQHVALPVHLLSVALIWQPVAVAVAHKDVPVAVAEHVAVVVAAAAVAAAAWS